MTTISPDVICKAVAELAAENAELKRKLQQTPEKGPHRPNRPKLSDNDVDLIKRMVRAGYTRREVADSFDVNPSTITRIVRGEYHR